MTAPCLFNLDSDAECEDSISFMNKELNVLGLPTIDNLFKPFDPNLKSVIKTCCELLCVHHRDVQNHRNSEYGYQRLRSDLTHAQTVNEKLKKDLQLLKQNCRLSKERLKSADTRSRSSEQHVNKLNNEVKRLQSVMQKRDKIQKSNMKKLEKECDKLKDRINALLTEKPKIPAIDISSTIVKVNIGRSSWRIGPSRAEEDVNHLVISSYERRQCDLLEENRDLRCTIESMCQQLQSLVRTTSSSSVSNHQTPDGDEEFPCFLNQEHFQMPFELIKPEVDSQFRKIFEHLKLLLSDSPNTLIEGQMETVSRSPAIVPSDVDLNLGTEMYEMNVRLQKIKQLISEQEDMLKKKEAVMNKSKQSVCCLHVTPDYKKTGVGNHSTYTCEVTPAYTGDNTDGVKTPSTDELYRYLGLDYKSHDMSPGDEDHPIVNITPSPLDSTTRQTTYRYERNKPIRSDSCSSVYWSSN